MDLHVDYIKALYDTFFNSLIVHYLLKLMFILLSVGPRFIIDPAVNQEVLIDEEFNLTCVSEGFPRPSIMWFFNNTMIINGVTDLNISTNALSSTLTKSNANINDSGIYYCLAVSSEFSGFNVTSEDAIITVVGT